MTAEETTDLNAGTALTIPLDRLIPNPDYQPRAAGLSEAHLRLLVESGADVFPPLLVSPNADGTFDVLDGFHRLEAARRLSVAALPCLVSPEAGYGEAVAANLRHGLPLSMADRKDAARWWADHEPDLSYREIGRRCGLSDKTVKRAVESDDDDTGPSSRTAPEPIERLVTLVYQTYRDRHGRTLFGLGGDGNPKAFRREIETYPEDERHAVARALSAFGQACVAASQPYSSGDHR